MKLSYLVASFVVGILNSTAFGSPLLPEDVGESLIFSIRNQATGRCLSLSHPSTDLGITIVQVECAQSELQQFEIRNVDKEFFTIEIPYSQKCVDVSHISYAPGARLHQWTCHGGQNQRFRISARADQSYTISAQHSSQCINIMFGIKASFVPVAQFPCGSLPSSEGWELQLIP